MPHQKTSTLTQQALSCVQTGNLTEARRLYSQLCQLNKDNAEAWRASAGVHLMLGGLEQAESCCRRAVELLNSVARWQRYEQHLGPLKQALGP